MLKVNQAKNKKIKQKIIKSEAEISQQRKLLGQNIRQLYLEGDMTTAEKLVTSKDLSEYVDQEQYRLSLQTQVNNTLNRINALKVKQETQKQQSDQLIADQKLMRRQAGIEKKEVGKLLALNKEEQADYNSTITANKQKISVLQKKQAEENERFLRAQAAKAKAAEAAEARRQAEEAKAAARRETPSRAAGASAAAKPQRPIANYVDGRNYPWAWVRFPNSMPDPWGMYKRQCVSYTAWKVSTSGRHMPYWGGRGNAKLWDNNARAAGIPVDSKPRVGDVAVSNSGTYGHVMYVEAIHGDGTITISQYNARWTGTYSVARIYPGSLVFIHF